MTQTIITAAEVRREGVMSDPVIQERDGGPYIGNTRLTVYHIVPYLFDRNMTEGRIALALGLTEDDVAAARSYVVEHFDDVMAEHRRIEDRNHAGNGAAPSATGGTRPRMTFQEWLEKKRAEEANAPAGESTAGPPSSAVGPKPRLTFREWLAAREAAGSGGGGE